jgi:hypothetical protein
MLTFPRPSGAAGDRRNEAKHSIMTSISSLAVIRNVAVDDGATAAAQAAAAQAAAAQAATAAAAAAQDMAADRDSPSDGGASRSMPHRSIDQRIDALVGQGRAHQISADQADELKQLLAGNPASAAGPADPAGDAATPTTAPASYGDQLDALSKTLDKLRTSLTRHAAYGAAGTAGDGGLVFDRLA